MNYALQHPWVVGKISKPEDTCKELKAAYLYWIGHWSANHVLRHSALTQKWREQACAIAYSTSLGLDQPVHVAGTCRLCQQPLEDKSIEHRLTKCIEGKDTLADFKYGVNTDVNTGVSVSRGGNMLFEVMGIC